jgi:hypothetical protein
MSLHNELFTFQVWCVDGKAKTALPKEDNGKFYSGDCYIILYTYHSGDKKEEYYLNYWIGKDSTAVIIVAYRKLLPNCFSTLSQSLILFISNTFVVYYMPLF